LNDLASIRSDLQAKFAYVESRADLPLLSGGSMLEKVFIDPHGVFYFLEFLLDIKYIDVIAESGMRFLDDKTTWEFFLMSENGFLRIYDWKGYSVSVGFVGSGSLADVSEPLRKDAKHLAKLIEQYSNRFAGFRKAASRAELESDPFGNFIIAFTSLRYLFNLSLLENKSNSGHLESLILLVSLIDTELRYIILLTRINQRKTKGIDEDLQELYQQTGNQKFITERGIFKIAEQEVDFSIHDKASFFERVNTLYDERNRAVHRYAITSYQYNQSKEAVMKYKNLIDILDEIVEKLEKRQVELKVGFLNPNSFMKSESEMEAIMHKILETKVDPTALYHSAPTRVAIFSDEYTDGIHPAYKKFADEAKRQLQVDKDE
ncbi:MAG TPA: hypothetical protein VD794_12690, partial [Flavisolibacter sp.]|nr:hypothetical protein [Flavisolibacter sp.]